MIGRSCEWTRERIAAYLEHEAGPAEALEIAAHLGRCAMCADETARERELLRALRSMPSPAPRTDVASGVMKRLREVRAALPARRALKWSALGLLGLLLLDGLRPGSPTRSGIRTLSRLGELIDCQTLAGRLLDLLPDLLPAATGLADLPGAATGGAASSPLGPWVGAAVILLSGAALLALLSGVALVGWLLAPGRARTLAARFPSSF